MYIGNGQMVHASTWSKPVLVASMNLKTFQGGRRVA
jgi:cell wall-associated NlpC family hydrolase